MKVLAFTLLAVLFGFAAAHSVTLQPRAQGGASATIVESIPIAMDLTTQMSTYDSWMWLINNAVNTIEMAHFYFELTDGQFWPRKDGGWMGMDIDAALRNASKRGVQIRLVINQPDSTFNDSEAFDLARDGVLELRNVSWASMFDGGILHTKLMIADGQHAYIGSCNAGWTSLSQVKELGVLVQNAADIVSDVLKIWEQYWSIAQTNVLPPQWPAEWDTAYNVGSPGNTMINGLPAQWYIAETPARMCPSHRTWDLTAIQAAMAAAKKRISISVMDYLPVTMYQNPNVYFAGIDDAIRSAAFLGVQVNMLISKWNHSSDDMWQYLYSLKALKNVNVRIFECPPMPGTDQIPFTRVNHAKYMVTENIAYISTQNWSGDYFLTTGGLAIAIAQDDFVAHLQAIFDRDWNSQYAYDLPSPLG